MSKFWAADSSSSSISSSASSDDEDFFGTSQADTGISAAAASKYGGDSDSDDWGESRRVVLSAKEKRIVELNKQLENLCESVTEYEFRDAQKAWDALQTGWKKHVKAEGLPTSTPPAEAWLRALTTLQDALEGAKGERLPKLEARAANSLRASLKKQVQGDLAKRVEDFRENGDPFAEFGEKQDGSGSSDEASSEEESSSEEEAPSAAGKRVTFADMASGSDSADESEGDSGDSFWSDDEEDESEGDVKEEKESRKSKWMLDSDDEDAKKPTGKPGAKKVRSKSKGKKVSSKKSDAGSKQADDEEEEAATEWTAERVVEVAQELLGRRGMRGNDARKTATQWKNLFKKTQTMSLDSAMQASVQTALIAAQFDTAPSLVLPLPGALWRGVVANINVLLDLLKAIDSGKPTKSLLDPTILVEASLAAFTARIDEEWLKTLRKTDPSKKTYVNRLRDEPALLAVLDRTADMLSSVGAQTAAGSIATRLLEHLYYRRASPNPADAEGAWLSPEDHATKVNALVAKITSGTSVTPVNSNNTRDPRSVVRAVLSLCFFEATTGKFAEAKERLVTSKVAESIHNMDTQTQALYNRTLAALGMSAFRQGNFSQAHVALVELCSSSKTKELLSQGITLNRMATPAERAAGERERERQLPYHMHLNLDLLEAMYLIAAMLIEVPASKRHHTVSRGWRRLLDMADKQAFAGPPESTRECVLVAARCLAAGDWAQAETAVWRIKALDLVPPPHDELRERLRRALQDAALVAYVRAYSTVYNSMSLESLAARFVSEPAKVYTVLSKLIMAGELAASWDGDALVLAGERPAKLHATAFSFTDRLATFLEWNEREFDAVQNGMSLFKDVEVSAAPAVPVDADEAVAA